MANKVSTDITLAGQELQRIVDEVGIDGKRVVAAEMQYMAMYGFPQACLRFYPSVLRVRTGNLRRSFAGFSERASDTAWRVGMRSRGLDYAVIQHEGTTGGKGRRPIRAKKFFSVPMANEIPPMVQRIKDKIGFR